MSFNAQSYPTSTVAVRTSPVWDGECDVGLVLAALATDLHLRVDGISCGLVSSNRCNNGKANTPPQNSVSLPGQGDRSCLFKKAVHTFQPLSTPPTPHTPSMNMHFPSQLRRLLLLKLQSGELARNKALRTATKAKGICMSSRRLTRGYSSA